jgi:GNAT superfamily N-acetyltransferase
MSCDPQIRVATPEDAEAIARVHLQSWQTAYRGILPDSYLDGLMAAYPKRVERWRAGLQKPEPAGTVTFLASAPEAIGFATAGFERKGRTDFRGELYAIYLLGAHRGRGLGTRLFERCVEHLRSLNLDTMIVWVIKDNPWRSFYEAMGGTVVPGARIEAVIGDAPVVEVAYGWNGLPEVSPEPL